MRFRLILPLGIVIALPAVAADAPTGSYRLSADLGGDSFTALLAFSSPKNQLSSQFLGGLGALDAGPQLKPTVRDVRITGDRLRFTLALSANQAMTFDGKLPTG